MSGAQLYEHHDELYAYLRAILRDPHEAEDAVQEIFARALKALPGYDFRRPLRHWLLVIARNHGLDVHAKRARLRLDDPHAVAALREADALRDGELPSGSLELVDLIAPLPVLQRQVLGMYYLLGFPTRDIAALLGTSPDSVRHVKARALANVRRAVAPRGRDGATRACASP